MDRFAEKADMSPHTLRHTLEEALTSFHKGEDSDEGYWRRKIQCQKLINWRCSSLLKTTGETQKMITENIDLVGGFAEGYWADHAEGASPGGRYAGGIFG